MYDLQDWAAVQRVYKQTRSKRATAKILGMSRNTVRSLLEEKEAPVYKRTVYKSKIDDFKEQIIEQRRLNAAFSHDLRTPLTLLKGHATMLLSFIPKGLVSQEEILDEISVMSKNISRLEKYVNAMTNL